MAERVDTLKNALSPVILSGYTNFIINAPELSFNLIACRPHSMGGGPIPGFKPYLKAAFKVETMDDSATKLKTLVDRSQYPILFLAHNGPTGLGDSPDSIWGCDFSAEKRDFGDLDLNMSIKYAVQKGHCVLGVVAGHMHHKLKNKGMRKWFVKSKDISYINSARVPRIFKEKSELLHHHIKIVLRPNEIETCEVLIGENLKLKRCTPAYHGITAIHEKE